ncbi:MAG TPA: wax ester/triacylglycerol synthase family O-acyltransferase, partial [Nocardioides sp.]|nr:wax ester/triacylglycerol synthase family O-acyltransferase [Nocardioides sp.]
MNDRVRSRDLAFLENETPTAPCHNATVEVFDPGDPSGPGGGFDYDRFVALILDRIPFVPRYRQRVQEVPGHLANPVWVDDDHFDIGYHVRRSALPRPGSTEQLRELVSRIVSRPLDRSRPLWEIYFVEGLADGRVALLYKTHQALVDGVETVDLGQVLLDKDPDVQLLGNDEWHPHRHPSPAGLVASALHDLITERGVALDTAQHAVGSVLRTADRF